ncbi:MAG: NUDIX domain-containing protein [bacterium]|nr:NUDIX domain-containing protein [bacterium]
MAHIHEKIDFTTSALIVYNNRVLLRMHDKYHMWLSVGGHIELDEDPNQALIREVKEEVGLDIEIIDHRTGDLSSPSSFQIEGRIELIPPRFMNKHSISTTHEHIDLIYIVRATSDSVQPAAGEPITECHWFTIEELDDLKYDFRNDIRWYAKTALREAGT